MAVLGKIRQRVGLLVFIIAAAILAFILMDVTSSSQGVSGNPNAIGSVNGQEISAIEYEERVQNIVSNYQNSGLNVDDRTRLNIREQAWNQYVEDQLTQKEFSKLGISVPDDELKQLLLGDQPHPTIAQAPLFKGENGQFDRNRLRQYVEGFKGDTPQAQSQRAQWATFEQSVQREQVRKKYTNMISKAIYVPSALAKQQNVEKGKKANVSYVQVPYANITDDAITVSDADLQNYLKAHKGDFEAKETRTLEHVAYPIAASPEDDANAKKYVTERVSKFQNTAPEETERFLKRQYTETPYDPNFVTLDQIQSEQKETLFNLAVGSVHGPYVENGAYVIAKLVDRKSVADSIKIRVIAVTFDKAGGKDKARTRIDSINTVLSNGGDFEALASSHSEDESRQTGGELANYIKPGQFPTELNSALFYENNEAPFISPTPNAWYLVEILERLGGTESVQLGYLTKKIEPSKATRDGIYQKASRFAGMNRSVEALRAAAEKEGIELQTAAGLTRNSFEIEGVGVASDIVSWAFQNDVGNVAERVFQVDDQEGDKVTSNYVVVALTGSSPEGTVALDNPSVRTAVENAVKQEKKAEKIKQEIGNNKDLQAISNALTDVKIDTIPDLDFNSRFASKLGEEPKVQATVFNLKQGDTEIVEGNRGVYVVKVNSFQVAPELSDAKAAQTEAATQLRTSVASPEGGVFKALVNAADIDDGRFNRQGR